MVPFGLQKELACGEKREENDDLWTINDERKEANALFCRFNPFMTGSYPPFGHPGLRSGIHSFGSRPRVGSMVSEPGAV